MLVAGHGTAPETTMGPLNTEQGVLNLEAYVKDAVNKRNGVVASGGHRLPGARGYFFEPTITLNAGADMLVAREDTSGPILAVCKFETEEQVVREANNTDVSLKGLNVVKIAL